MSYKKFPQVRRILTYCLCLRFVGLLLDWEAERVVDQLYVRDAHGIIQGLGTKAYRNGHKKALVWLHGLSETPQAFEKQFLALRKRDICDLHVPLQPYRGRNLQALRKIDNQVVLRFVARYCKQLAAQYDHLIIVGFSYSGALLLALHRQKRLPENITLVLQSPAIYNRFNEVWKNRMIINSYFLWRYYSNYRTLDSVTPTYESGDQYARKFLETEKGPRYKVAAAVKAAHRLDNTYRDELSKLRKPFYILMAQDDNRTMYEKIFRVATQNHNCHFYTFPQGSHIVHHGRYGPEIMDLLTHIIRAAPRMYQPSAALQVFFTPPCR